jgi:hypothetical protein
MHKQITRNASNSRLSSLTKVTTFLMSCLVLAACDPSGPRDRSKIHDEAGYAVAYRTDWSRGIDPRIGRQAPRDDSIRVGFVPEFGGPALMTRMRLSDDFHAVANGTPRAEVAFDRVTQFKAREDYEIRWSTMIPGDAVFDSQQPEIITQIHQSANAGSPPFSLLLTGERYQVEVRGRRVARRFSFGDAKADRGRVVSWLLEYKPDDTGAAAVTELYKDGVRVVKADSIENAYPEDDGAYLKLGVYKWDWKVRPTDVNVRTMYYGDVRIASRPRHSS